LRSERGDQPDGGYELPGKWQGLQWSDRVGAKPGKFGDYQDLDAASQD